MTTLPATTHHSFLRPGLHVTVKGDSLTVWSHVMGRIGQTQDLELSREELVKLLALLEQQK